MVRILDSGYKAAGNKGEFLTKRCLDFWIQSDEYEDKARPEFLRNPSTSKLLPTEVYSSENAVGDIKARDLIKECLGRHNGIIMVTVTAPDLEPALFDRLVPDKLPKSIVLTDSLYCQVLARLCRSYTAKTPGPSGRAIGREPLSGCISGAIPLLPRSISLMPGAGFQRFRSTRASCSTNDEPSANA